MSAKRSASSRKKGKSSRKEPGRKPSTSSEIKDDAPEDLQGLVASYQQQFRAALEKSGELLSQALSAHLSIYDQVNQESSGQLQPNIGIAPEAQFKPPTAEVVDKAYRRAKEMFDEIERASGPAQSGSHSPQMVLPGSEKRPGPAIEDPLAASALLMSQATQHLNTAMESVLQAMDQRLTGLVEGKGSRHAAPPGKKRPARTRDRG